jgi:hypothetical protein
VDQVVVAGKAVAAEEARTATPGSRVKFTGQHNNQK